MSRYIVTVLSSKEVVDEFRVNGVVALDARLGAYETRIGKMTEFNSHCYFVRTDTVFIVVTDTDTTVSIT